MQKTAKKEVVLFFSLLTVVGANQAGKGCWTGAVSQVNNIKTMVEKVLIVTIVALLGCNALQVDSIKHLVLCVILK